MGKTKEQKRAKKDTKVAEWLGVFVRAYEIARAYGSSVERAVVLATEDTNEYMRKDWKAVPQDRMFFIDCKMEMELKLKDAIVSAEMRSYAKV